MSRLQASVTDLSLAEKLQLVENLWDDLASNPEDIPIHDWQKEEIERRKANYDNAPDSGLSWDEVVRKIRARHGIEIKDAKDVYILWHVNEKPDGEEDAKLLGVYASAEDAEAARLRVLPQPGFRDKPNGFEVSPYSIGKDHWTEGYVTVYYDDPIESND